MRKMFRLMCLCLLAILASCSDNDDEYGQEVDVVDGKALVQRCYIKGKLGTANFEVDRRNDFSQDVYHAYTFYKDAAASAEGQVGVDWVVTLLSQPHTELLLHLKRPEAGTVLITRGQVEFKLSDMSRYEMDGMAVRVYNGDGKTYKEYVPDNQHPLTFGLTNVLLRREKVGDVWNGNWDASTSTFFTYDLNGTLEGELVATDQSGASMRINAAFELKTAPIL